MPRTKPTTILTPRTKLTTEYEKPRDRSGYPVTFDSIEISFDSTIYTWDMISEDLWPITTLISTPRMGYSVTDLSMNFVFDLMENQVQSLAGSGKKTNNIITKWS